jgi:hypothetical protein
LIDIILDELLITAVAAVAAVVVRSRRLIFIQENPCIDEW